MKRKINLICIKRLICILVLCMVVAAIPGYQEVLHSVAGITSADVLVVDAGHGGFDGGAESSAGVSEKNINLQIALCIEEMARRDGWNVIMTRNKDISLGEDEKGSIRSRKTKDLLERKRIISEVEPNAAVSIHLNSFKEDRRVHGAQVFYPQECKDKNIIEKSKNLAEQIQCSLSEGINDGTERQALGKSGVLIMKNVNCPMVIVECGFLSNNEEAEKLENEDYQRLLAKCIYEGILRFCGKEPADDIEVLDSREE